MAAVALVGIVALDLAAGQGLGLVEHLIQGMAVVRASGQRLGMQDELAALAASFGGGERDLDAELVWRLRLALADAFGLQRVPGSELPASLTLFLAVDLAGLGSRHGEGLAQPLVGADLAGRVR